MSDSPNPSSVSPEDVARKLAPRIALHSKDPHQPCSVDWLLQRCQVASGGADLSSGGFDLPSGMTIKAQAPLTAASVAATSSSSIFGGGEIDNISLFPITAAPNTQPRASWDDATLLTGYFTNIGEPLPQVPGSLPLPNPHFYNYQLTTALGQTVRVGRVAVSSVPIYCRIATRLDYYLISYFGLFPYNGGLGIGSSWGGRPLEYDAGWMAHIGDWIRLTAKVHINGDRVGLEYVDYEAHGDPNIVTSGAFSGLTLDQIPQIKAYAAWHSHEMYPTAGVHPRPSVGFTANDYTDDAGVLWDTSTNLTFVSDDGPAWIRFNGIWGANVTVDGIPADYLKNGPQGPAFHWYWISETKDGQSPISQWRPASRPALPAPSTPTWTAASFGPGRSPGEAYPGYPVTATWGSVSGATAYVATIRRDGFPVSVQETTAPTVTWQTVAADLYRNISVSASAIASDAPPSPGSPQSTYLYVTDGLG